MTSYVAYVRVSTARQSRSGLGLAAQRHRITEFAGPTGEIIAWFEESESGANCQRVELERALTQCELTGSCLLVATLDRLTRDVAFLELVKHRCEAGGFSFRCADLPDATEFVLGILIQVAAYERQRICERTSLALQAAKRRGVKLGNPNGTRNFEGKRTLGARRAGVVHRAKADSWAEKRRGVVTDLVAEGLGCSEIAMTLAERRITTPRGSLQWTATGVKRLLDRLNRLDATA